MGKSWSLYRKGTRLRACEFWFSTTWMRWIEFGVVGCVARTLDLCMISISQILKGKTLLRYSPPSWQHDASVLVWLLPDWKPVKACQSYILCYIFDSSHHVSLICRWFVWGLWVGFFLFFLVPFLVFAWWICPYGLFQKRGGRNWFRTVIKLLAFPNLYCFSVWGFQGAATRHFQLFKSLLLQCQCRFVKQL